MAPAAGTKSETATTTTAAKTPSLLDTMEVEESVLIPMRGRGFDPDVLAIRGELEKMQKEGGAVRSFKDVAEEDKETYGRKVRAAGKIAPAIKVSTRYDKRTSKLFWGPSANFESLGQS